MKFAANRRLANPETAARKVVEIAAGMASFTEHADMVEALPADRSEALGMAVVDSSTRRPAPQLDEIFQE